MIEFIDLSDGKMPRWEKTFLVVISIVVISLITLFAYAISTGIKDIYFSDNQCQNCNATGLEGYDNYCYHCGAEIERN